MSAFDRALRRVREETGTVPEAMTDAAAWLSRSEGEGSPVPPDLLDRFTAEETARKQPSPEPGLDGDALLAGFREERVDEPPSAVAAPAQPIAGAPTIAEPMVGEPTTGEPAPFADPPAATAYPGPETGEPVRGDAARGLFNGFNPRLAGMIVAGPQMDEATVEQYGRLAAVLHHAQLERTIKTVMVTSAMAGEGKTLTALNLALTLSESYGRRVAFLDADLRCSRVHELLNVVRVTGLSEALEDDSRIQARMLEVTPRLSVLLAGCSNLDPKGALTSKRMGQILADAAATFDWVIVDTPPVVLLPDTHLLARMVDVAIVVVRAGRTSYDSVERAIQALDKKRVLGVVLNDAQDTEALQYYYSSKT